MKLTLLTVALVYCVFSVKSAEFPTEDGIYTITTDNYDEALETFPPTLFVFCSTWCVACKKLYPELVKVAKQLVDLDKNARIAHVDIDDSADIAIDHDVKTLPTMIFYGPDNQFSKYNGSRTSESIFNYITDNLD